MKPQRDSYAVESTVTGEAVRMQIDTAAMQHIMDLMTDVYADREMAAVREYATNARDAHVEAGNPDPIAVTTPTDLHPFLVIEDWGIGMDAADIRGIYSQYGASTKRDTNKATGMLGIGCKAALSYADQFTLIATKDGRRITVSVSRTEEGAGVMTILDDEEIEGAPNGVAVQIPARRNNDFATKAAELFRFWPAGSVLVNGEEPDRLEGFELTPEITVVDKTALDGERAVVVMGGVPYPAGGLFFENEAATLAYHKALILRVPIGAVEFPPSREALKNTPTTEATLDRLARELAAAKTAAMQREVDAAGTRAEAVAAQVRVQDALDMTLTVDWRGETIPELIEARDVNDAEWWHLPDTSRYYRAAQSVHNRARKLPLKAASRAVWVLGFSNRTWTATMRRKLDRYCAEHAIADALQPCEFVLTDRDALPSDWLESVRTVAWADVRAWKDPEAATGGGGGGETYAGTYATYLPKGWTKKYPAAEIEEAVEDGAELFYVVGSIDRERGGMAAMLREVNGDDALLVELADTRLAKFLRLFPAAREATEGLREGARVWWIGLTTEQRDALATFGANYYHRGTGMPALDAARVDDPELRRYVETGEHWTSELHQAHQRWQPYLPTDRATGTDLAIPTGAEGRYPLMPSEASGTLLEHVYLYVNTVYAKESE